MIIFCFWVSMVVMLFSSTRCPFHTLISLFQFYWLTDSTYVLITERSGSHQKLSHWTRDFHTSHWGQCSNGPWRRCRPNAACSWKLMVMEHPSKMSDSVAVWSEMANPQWPHWVTQSLQLHTYSFECFHSRLVSLSLLTVVCFLHLRVMCLYFCPRLLCWSESCSRGLQAGHSDINRSVRMKHLPDVNRRKKEKEAQETQSDAATVSWDSLKHDVWLSVHSSKKVHPLLLVRVMFFFAYIFRYAGCFPSFGTAFNTFLFPPEHLVAQLSIHKLLFFHCLTIAFASLSLCSLQNFHTGISQYPVRGVFLLHNCLTSLLTHWYWYCYVSWHRSALFQK